MKDGECGPGGDAHPSGPLEEVCAAAASALRSAGDAVARAWNAAGRPPDDALLGALRRGAMEMDALAADARGTDAASEAWLRWSAPEGRCGSARHGNTAYAVRADGMDTFYAMSSLPSGAWTVVAQREPTPDAARRACEDHVRRRGRFASRAPAADGAGDAS